MRSLGQCQGVSFCSSWQYISFEIILCHTEKQHANSGPSPLYVPLPSRLCNLSPLPSAHPPSFKCRSALALFIHSLPVVGRWQLYFSYSFCYQRVEGSFFLSLLFSLQGVGEDLVHRQRKEVTEIRPGRWTPAAPHRSITTCPVPGSTHLPELLASMLDAI